MQDFGDQSRVQEVRQSFLKVLVMFEQSLQRCWYKLYFKGPIMHPF